MKSRVLLGLALLVFGGALAVSAGRMLYRARSSEHWPVAEGTVLSSSVETLRSRRSASYVPHVRYSYAVGGQSFTSESIAFAPVATGDALEAQSYVRRYPHGGAVSVHYEPGAPEVACLDCGRAGVANYVVALGGAALALVAALGLVDVLRYRARARVNSPRASAG